jgi:hypothetical protein
MNRLLLATLLTFLLLGTATRLFAKGETVKITITGFDLRAPIEIADPQVLRRFNVWAGPGTGSTEPGFNPNVPSFVVDWSYGSVSNVPDRLTSYEVSFYAKLPSERLVYVVYYMYDPSARRGYVYLPGKDDEFYRLNISTIYHGVEGHWFRAWSAWDDVAAPLIKASLRRFDPGEPGEVTGTVLDLEAKPTRSRLPLRTLF